MSDNAVADAEVAAEYDRMLTRARLKESRDATATELDIAAIEARAARFRDIDHAVSPMLMDVVLADNDALLAEVKRQRRWKAEAIEVLTSYICGPKWSD